VRAVLVSGVTAPVSSGLGGGGFAMIYRAGAQIPIVLDFRETAPTAVDAAAFETRPFKPEERARATGVPGELAGLWELQRSYGKRAWRDVVAPAAAVARNGFAVSPHLARALAGGGVFATDPGIASVFFPKGKPALADSTVKNPKLAATLTRIAAQGKAALYAGETAREIVSTASAKGGKLSEADLRDYRVIERTALHVRWEGYDVYTMPLPSAGGLMVAQSLGLFSKAELEQLGPGSGLFQHTVAEAMRGALSDRMRFVGDPDFERVDVSALLDPRRLAARKRKISADKTNPLPAFDEPERGTHHLIVVDGEGTVACITTTVNTGFGAKLSTPNSGIVLNDELTDFSKQIDVAPFGLEKSPNRPRPGARPVSSMTPTIVVKNGKPVFALGGSGGPLIASNVTQLLLTRLASGASPDALVKQPRFWPPANGPTLYVNKGASPELLADLAKRGETVKEMSDDTTGVQVVAIDDNVVSAASDPRKHGSALTQ
jgi:gamma-glutamyltranspeptidase/glutathione hydrolase